MSGSIIRGVKEMWVDQPRVRIWEFVLPMIVLLMLVGGTLDGVATVSIGQQPGNSLTENASKADEGSSESSESADDAENETSSIAEQIKGKWVVYRETPQGRYTTIKVHNGTETIVTTYDPKLKEVYSHQSEYTLDDSGPVNVFTYRNKKVLIGRDSAAAVEGPVSYLFRIEGDRFLEVHGMMKGDTRGPSLQVWERLKKDPIERPAT